MNVVCPFCNGKGIIPSPERPLEIQVALRAGGTFSRLEWAYLIKPDKTVLSFKQDGRFVKREAGNNFYVLEASPGDLVVRGYVSGSGKTYRLGVFRVSDAGTPEPVAEFDNPLDAEKYLRALGIEEEIW